MKYQLAYTHSAIKDIDTRSKDLKRGGFRFFGSTIVYAFMQAVGMVDDHINDSFAKMRAHAKYPHVIRD